MRVRTLRIILGVLVSIVGLAGLLAGGAAAVLVGPDNVLGASSERLSSKGQAIVVSEELVSYYGPKLHITAESSDGPVFIGAAHTKFVESYLEDVALTSIDQVQFPFELGTSSRSGDVESAVAPTTRTWWRKQVDGDGDQTLVWPLPNGPYDVVIMRADGKSGVDVTVSFGLELEGAFGTALLIAGVGLVCLAGGILLIRGRFRNSASDLSDGISPNFATGPTPPPPSFGAPPSRPGGPMAGGPGVGAPPGPYGPTPPRPYSPTPPHSPTPPYSPTPPRSDEQTQPLGPPLPRPDSGGPNPAKPDPGQPTPGGPALGGPAGGPSGPPPPTSPPNQPPSSSGREGERP